MGTTIHIRYALLAIPLAFLGLPLYVYIPSAYAELPLIGLSMAGLVLLLARIIDLVTDPLVGYLTDRIRHRLHPLLLIIAGCPLLMIGIYRLFNPDLSAGPIYLAGYVIVSYLGLTLITIPYYAWGAEIGELGQQHRELAGWREGGVILGTVLALMVAALAADGNALTNMSWGLLVLLPIGVFGLMSIRRDPPLHHLTDWRLSHVWRGVGHANRRLLWIHFLNTLAAGMPATLFLLYVDQVLGLSPTTSGVLLLVYFLSAVLALPLWIRLSRRFGELTVWRSAIVFAAIGFLPAAFLNNGDLYWFMLVCMVTGATLGADVAIPAAMQARLASIASERQSRPQEASAFGLWGMASKLGLALAVGVTLPLLDLFPEGDAQTSALALLYALLPVSVKLLAASQLHSSRILITNALQEKHNSRSVTNEDVQADHDQFDSACYRL
jgi:Na+/melibiose symporter-like transporter